MFALPFADKRCSHLKDMYPFLHVSLDGRQPFSIRSTWPMLGLSQKLLRVAIAKLSTPALEDPS